jgi:hypothetical protein
MNYCCERFESAHNMPNHYGLNIRVVKYKEEELIDKKYLYRYYITPGYFKEDARVPNFNIAYCPFCGINLFSFYHSDRWVNENSGKF